MYVRRLGTSRHGVRERTLWSESFDGSQFFELPGMFLLYLAVFQHCAYFREKTVLRGQVLDRIDFFSQLFFQYPCIRVQAKVGDIRMICLDRDESQSCKIYIEIATRRQSYGMV